MQKVILVMTGLYVGLSIGNRSIAFFKRRKLRNIPYEPFYILPLFLRLKLMLIKR